MAVTNVSYTAAPTIRKYILSEKEIDIIMGPVGSGKSVGSIMKIIYECRKQPLGKDGKRRSRWAIIRNTNPQLMDTTLKTWFQWFPDGGAGTWMVSEKTFYLKIEDIEAEIMFRPLDTPKDVQRTLSLELTGAYFNELREIDKTIFDAVRTRIGRYPAKKDGGAVHPCIIADTNPPNRDSWLYELMEEPGPRDRELIDVFKQPGGLDPDAENLENLRDGYYENMLIGADEDFVNVHVHGKYGKSNLGKPVHQRFTDRLHITKEKLTPISDALVVIGMDFGLTPAAVFKQMDGWGKIITYDAVWTKDDYLENFVNTKVLPLIKQKYYNCPILVVGDPSGKRRAEGTGVSCFDVLEKAGLIAQAAPTNDPEIRIGATDHWLGILAGDMRAAYQVSSSCSHLIKALEGGYRYPKKRNGDLLPSPEKNIYSHVAEANQYADMFFQSGRLEKFVAKLKRKKEQATSGEGYSPFDSEIGY